MARKREKWRLKIAALTCAAAALLAFAPSTLRAQTYTTLYNFQGQENCTNSGYPNYITTCTIYDGASPEAGLFRDASGNLFGTTSIGGIKGEGTAFQIASGGTTDVVLVNFGAVLNGVSIWSVRPGSALVRDKNGNFYGTSTGGEWGNGDVFELSPPAAAGGAWTWTELHSFGGLTAGDGTSPSGDLWLDSSGNLYGTAFSGGNLNCGVNGGCGTVWTLNVYAASPASTYQTIYTFAGGVNDGHHPYAGLIEDSNGNLWGTTTQGGGANEGTVFELTPPALGSSTWSEQIWPFTGGPQGSDPEAALVMDTNGVLYGTSRGGGAFCSDSATLGCGTVFKLNPATDTAPSVMHAFAGGAGTPADGSVPLAGLTLVGNTLYGDTSNGGVNFDGTLFKINTDGSNYADIHDFAGADGEDPTGILTADASGNLYGTTQEGGTGPSGSGAYCFYGCGTVFEFGVASAPAVALNPTSLSFNNVVLNTQSSAQTVTVTNTGTANLIFGSGAVTLTGTNQADFAITSDGCSNQTIGFTSPNNTCSVSVSFTPTTTGTTESASLNFADNAAGSPQTVGLTGTGVQSAATLSPSSLTFSSQPVTTTSPAQTVTLTNTGSTPLTINSISASLSEFAVATPTTGTPCSTSTPVAGNGTCGIGVTFTPASTDSGKLAGTLSVDYAGAGSPQTVTLIGTALANAQVTDNETIHVTDTPVVMGAALVTDNTETIHVTDTPLVMGAAMVMDNSEVIHVTDTPSFPSNASAPDNEAIKVTDTVLVMPSAMATDGNETIAVTDTPNVIALTAQQATQIIVNNVSTLYAQGVINSGQDNSLVGELDQALTMMNKGKINGAIKNLEYFISEVQDLECSAVLTSVQAQPLITAASNVIEQLGGVPPAPAACP